MLRKDHIFKNSLCLILTLSLILLPAGCGEKSENTDSSISIGTSNEADSSLASNAADTALPQGTETPEETEVIEDKFVMLREVYDILSGPLGKPYRTPEYWGGEEIDMMKVGNNYLIALRNVQNQMHYLLYERETNSIIEINTQGKHIPWDQIYEDTIDQEIHFYYFATDAQTQMVRRGRLTYSLSNHSCQDSGLDTPSLPRPEELFEILSPALNNVDKIYTFDFLSDILNKLPEIYFTDYTGWYNFDGRNICVLNYGNYTLICLDGYVVKYYYLYQKSGTVATITPMDAPTTFWDVIRFQQDEEYLVFPSPTGQQIANIYYSFADFPYITLLPLDSPTHSTKRKLPLWDQEEEKHYLLGRTLCYAEWEVYHIWQSENEFSIEWERREPNICPSGDDCCPEIRVKTSPDRSVTVWIRKNILSEEDKQQLLNLQIKGIQNIQLSSATLQEIEPMIKGKTKEELMEEGTCLSFTLEEGYQLYGEFSCTDHLNHPEAFLYFYTARE